MRATAREVVSRSNGVFLLDAGRVSDSELTPPHAEELSARAKLRRDGQLTPEEATLIDRHRGEPLVTRDRRLVREGIELIASRRAVPDPIPPALDRTLARQLLLDEAARALAAEWDPSVHLQESVRSIAELDHIRNLLGERLASWSARDVRTLDGGETESVEGLARALVEGSAEGEPALAPADAAITQARSAVAALYLEVEATRERLESALTEATPRTLPNLSALLGPLLAARLLSQAGGVERLARLPASTIQVLGAERAFFEHLRGHGPPPRHGLLFVHPDIQGRPRTERGRTARALAGKVAIAARLDASGAPLRPELVEQFRSRSAAIRASPRKSIRGGRRRPPR